MKDDEMLDELQRSLRATHDPAQKIRPRSRDCGNTKMHDWEGEKKKKKPLGHEAGSCWPACVSSKKKKDNFLRAIKTCKPQRLGSVRKPPAELILAEGGGAAGKTVTRQTETISTKVGAAFTRIQSPFLLFLICRPTKSQVLVSGATV